MRNAVFVMAQLLVCVPCCRRRGPTSHCEPRGSNTPCPLPAWCCSDAPAAKRQRLGERFAYWRPSGGCRDALPCWQGSIDLPAPFCAGCPACCAVPQEDAPPAAHPPPPPTGSAPVDGGAGAAAPAGVPPAAASVCPPHPGFMGGLCIRCGALRDEAEEKGVALSYIHRGLEVSKHEAERLRQVRRALPPACGAAGWASMPVACQGPISLLSCPPLHTHAHAHASTGLTRGTAAAQAEQAERAAAQRPPPLPAGRRAPPTGCWPPAGCCSSWTWTTPCSTPPASQRCRRKVGRRLFAPWRMPAPGPQAACAALACNPAWLPPAHFQLGGAAGHRRVCTAALQFLSPSPPCLPQPTSSCARSWRRSRATRPCSSACPTCACGPSCGQGCATSWSRPRSCEPRPGAV